MFDVPDGVPGLLVEVDYVKAADAALDLGLSDPNGFRGWSGSARSRIALGQDRATPGYLRGSLPAGTWALEIGLHRIPDRGLPCTVVVSFVDEAEEEEVWPDLSGGTERRRRELPAPPGFSWLAGDLRAHSVHSDGTDSVGALARRASDAGLDFVVVGDFNTISHYRDAAEASARGDVRVIPGQTVAIDNGHALLLGIDEWVDLRTDFQVWSKKVRERGGAMSVNHPVKADSGWIQPVSEPPQLAEIWSGGWDGLDRAPLAWWTAAGPAVAPVGGSGWTGDDSAATLGSPVTWVLADGDDVIGGLRAGRTAVSSSVDGPVLIREGGDVIAIGAAGLRLVRWDGTETSIDSDEQRFEAEPMPAFIHDDGGRVRAICSGCP